MNEWAISTLVDSVPMPGKWQAGRNRIYMASEPPVRGNSQLTAFNAPVMLVEGVVAKREDVETTEPSISCPLTYFS